MKKIINIGLFLLVGSTAFAGNQFEVTHFSNNLSSNLQDGYKFNSVKIREVVPSAEEIYGFIPEMGTGIQIPENGSNPSKPANNSPKPADSSSTSPDIKGLEIADWEKIVIIGERVINIIKQGAPVVNVKRDAVYAIPGGLTDWQLLEGWQFPVTKVYQIQMDNAFGMSLVDVRVKVSAMYGGSYMGRGKYLANVVIVPTAINVQYGVSFDLWSEYSTPLNMGSIEAPVAGLEFDIRFSAKTWVTAVNGTQDYFVSGAGDIRQIQ